MVNGMWYVSTKNKVDIFVQYNENELVVFLFIHYIHVMLYNNTTGPYAEPYLYSEFTANEQ